MAEHQTLKLSEIPLSALKKSTLVTLSASLNQNKILPTSDGLPRDWRGLAQLMGLNGMEASQISLMQDHFLALVELWGAKGNISLFQQYLGFIDRYDVLDDTKEAIAKDSLDYENRKKKVNSSELDISIEADKRILTVDDVTRLKKGLEPQIYDAYVLYAEEDAEFASEIIETMENKYNFKLCVRDRDLIGGVQFEHDAITKLIAERCRRLVVIVSSNFLRSKANKFFVTFAQALGIDIRERKVIPILYERCEVPPELSYYFLLDYNRAGKLWNFWDKLRDSIQAPEVSESNMSKSNGVTSTSAKSANDLWISRTHFESKTEEPEISHSEISITELKPPKKVNIYKILKNRFKVKRRGNNQTPEEKIIDADSETSLIDHLATMVSGDEVPFENFDNSSSFETKDDESSNSEKSKKMKNKKWYKKRAVDALLS